MKPLLYVHLTLAALLVQPAAAFAHEAAPHAGAVAVAGATGENPGEPRWLAGDHHIHSRNSTGYDTKQTPPAPILGGDAIYPIAMNALMARHHGLDWVVATDHGGPNHSKVHHDHAYPELLMARKAVPDLVQFFGMEFDTPGADHSSIVVPAGADEAERLRALESTYSSREAFPLDPARNTEPKMLEALRAMKAQSPAPVLFAHHPSRSASALGVYGMTGPAELRDWNDTAPEVAIGMEGAPGHQASAEMRPGVGANIYSSFLGSKRPRGAYGQYPTMGGFDQMTARLGGFWDSMLGEGRRWWITATSDSHVHWSDGGIDFWPGEYSKTYVHARKAPADIIAGLRAGRVFVVTGDLIDSLDFTAQSPASGQQAMIGGALAVKRGERIKLTIRFRDPETLNHHGQNPSVARVDLIAGPITGKSANRSLDSNPGTRVVARFTAANWQERGGFKEIEYELDATRGPQYIRLRGTNTAELEPEPDADGQSAWDDLWFYSNPIFLELPRR
jgi:hypothetical protein